MEKNSVDIKVMQSFLETARSIHNIELKTNSEMDFNMTNIASVSLGLTAISIIFSYMTIEAFVNKELYKAWKKYRHIKKLSDKDPTFIKEMPNIDLYKKYSSCDDFKNLKNMGLGELKKRINDLCDIKGIDRIYKIDNGLWSKFLEFEKKARHFLTFPHTSISRSRDI